MTPFEKAQIRLKVWEALAGWGTKNTEEKFPEPWNWEDRLKFADLLFKWVCEIEEDSNEHS
jgi:hypothetical protein